MKYVLMPFDSRLVEIMDYTRMICDMANCYITQPKDELNQSIAFVYYGFLNSHFQIFFYTIRIWMAENAEFVGKMMASDTDVLDEKRSKAHGNELISPGEAMWVIELIYSFLRYYWIQTVVNMMSLSMICAQTLEATEVKRINRIMENIIELGGTAQFDLQYISSSLAHTECGKVLTDLMPSVGYDFHVVDELAHGAGKSDSEGRSNPSAGGGSSGVKSKISDTFFSSVIGKDVGQQNFITLSRSFTPVQSVTLDLNVDLNVRLDLDYKILRKDLAKLQHPGERQCYYYTNWFNPRDTFIVPGHNSHFLEKNFPDYTQKLNALMEKKKIRPELRVKGTSSVKLTSKLSAGVAEAVQHQEKLISFESSEVLASDRVNSFDLVDKKDTYANPLLNLRDLKTTRLLELEEAFIIETPCLMIMAHILLQMGNVERAKEFNTLMRETARTFYGETSPEYVFITGLLTAFIPV
ncbi:sodium stibogluconate resistance protein [Angomonas deanei]|nr:sodium stibogluconate resistance protein [Angomonas deanei]|eukprot:EPY18092.1 sodium stibogluconate resistance protein [Angomonas deanei]